MPIPRKRARAKNTGLKKNSFQRVLTPKYIYLCLREHAVCLFSRQGAPSFEADAHLQSLLNLDHSRHFRGMPRTLSESCDPEIRSKTQELTLKFSRVHADCHRFDNTTCQPPAGMWVISVIRARVSRLAFGLSRLMHGKCVRPRQLSDPFKSQLRWIREGPCTHENQYQ